MTIIKNQLLLLLCIFIIFISLIIYFYINKKKNNENFVNSNVINFSLSDFNDDQAPDVIQLQTAINNQLGDFNTKINRYSVINPFITVNSDGKLCDTSTQTNLNFCEIHSSSGNNEPTCLINGLPSSCNKLFSDGYINTISNMDLNSLTNGTHSTIISKSALLINDINDRRKSIDNTLSIILSKIELQNQQEFVVNNTADTIDSKKTILQNTTDDFEKLENDVFINQYNFQNYLIQNNNNNKKIALYRSILYGLVIAIIVTGIFLYFVS